MCLNGILNAIFKILLNTIQYHWGIQWSQSYPEWYLKVPFSTIQVFNVIPPGFNGARQSDVKTLDNDDISKLSLKC